jgi:hypothetical protein
MSLQAGCYCLAERPRAVTLGVGLHNRTFVNGRFFVDITSYFSSQVFVFYDPRILLAFATG